MVNGNDDLRKEKSEGVIVFHNATKDQILDAWNKGLLKHMQSKFGSPPYHIGIPRGDEEKEDGD